MTREQKINHIGTKEVPERKGRDNEYEMIVTAMMQKAIFQAASFMAKLRGEKNNRILTSEIAAASCRVAALFNAHNPRNTLDQSGDEWREVNGKTLADFYVRFSKELAQIEHDKPGEILRIIMSASGEEAPTVGIELAK